jgi:hypothetical protein
MISLQKTIAKNVTRFAAEKVAFGLGEISVRADVKKEWDYSSPSATTIFNQNKGKEGFPFKSIREVAEFIIASVPQDHEMIEKAAILEVPVSKKAQNAKDKKKKKKEGEAEEGKEEVKEEVDTAGPPCFLNYTLKNSFLENEIQKIIRNGLAYTAETK